MSRGICPDPDSEAELKPVDRRYITDTVTLLVHDANPLLVNAATNTR